MNSFYFDKMHMLYNQNKSCVKSCQKTLLLKKQHCFPQKNTWNEKLSLIMTFDIWQFLIYKDVGQCWHASILLK